MNKYYGEIYRTTFDGLTSSMDCPHLEFRFEAEDLYSARKIAAQAIGRAALGVCKDVVAARMRTEPDGRWEILLDTRNLFQEKTPALS